VREDQVLLRIRNIRQQVEQEQQDVAVHSAAGLGPAQQVGVAADLVPGRGEGQDEAAGAQQKEGVQRQDEVAAGTQATQEQPLPPEEHPGVRGQDKAAVHGDGVDPVPVLVHGGEAVLGQGQDDVAADPVHAVLPDFALPDTQEQPLPPVDSLPSLENVHSTFIPTIQWVPKMARVEFSRVFASLCIQSRKRSRLDTPINVCQSYSSSSSAQARHHPGQSS